MSDRKLFGPKSLRCFVLVLRGTFAASIIVLVASTPMLASPITLNWAATLTVLPGQESNLPPGVMDGDMIMGSILWDPDDPHLVSHSSLGQLPEFANYDPDAWTLDLGLGNLYGRLLNDGLGLIGNGNIQIRNDDDTVADGLTLNDAFNFQNSLNPSSPPINEYIYGLRLIDDDRTVFDDFSFNGNDLDPFLPNQLLPGDFEHTILSLTRIQLDPSDGKWHATLVAEMTSLKSLSTVPEPSTIVFAALAVFGLLAHGHRPRRA